MREVVMLGTGTPDADPHRAGSGVAIVEEGSWFLVDCGRAVTQRALEAGLDLRLLAGVALTHHHTDHVSDLATLATTCWSAGRAGALPVVAPSGPTARFGSTCLDVYEDQAFHRQGPAEAGRRPTVDLVAFEAPSAPAVVATLGPWTIVSALVDHQPMEAAVGYRISDGVHTVAVSGDTAVGPGIRALASGADVLVHEALVPGRVAPDLLVWNAGADEVGRLAAASGVGVTVVTHVLPAPQSDADVEALVQLVRGGGYVGDVVVADDLLRVPLGG